MSDQQQPELQLAQQGGSQPSTLATLSGAGTPEDHWLHDEQTTEMKLTLGKVDTNVQTLLSRVAAIQTRVNEIENALTGIAGLIRLQSGVSLGNAVQTILQKVTQ